MVFYRQVTKTLCLGASFLFLPALVSGTTAFAPIAAIDAAAAETREERRVQSIISRIEKLAEKIEAHETGERDFTDRTLTSLTKQLDRFDDQLSEYDGTLGFDDAEAMLAGLSNRIDALNDQLAAALEQTGGLTQREFDRQIKDVERLTQQAERILKDAERIDLSRVTDASKVERMEKALAKLEDNAADIIDLIPGYEELRSAIEEARTATRDTRLQVDQALSARDGATDRLAGYFQSGKVLDDSAFVFDLLGWADDVVSSIDRTTGELVLRNALDDAQTYLSWAERVAPGKARLDQIREDYAGITPDMLRKMSREMEATLGEEASRTGGISAVIDGRLDRIELAFAALEDLRDDSVEVNRAQIERADQEMARLAAELDYQTLVFGNSVLEPIEYGEALITILDGFGSDVSAQKTAIETQVADARARHQAMIDRVYADIVATNEIPLDDYQGSDAGALIAAATEIFDQVVEGEKLSVGALIPPQDWTRYVGDRLSGNTLEYYNESRIYILVFSPEPEDRLSRWMVAATKDHLNNDRIGYVMVDPVEEIPVSPYRVFPKDSIPTLRR
ncbi:MAG: hypothetical protein AAF755_12075 [Pseudomonadota bacterium]